MTDVSVTMIDKRVGEHSEYLEAGQTYTVSEPFARLLVQHNMATAEFRTPTSDGWDDLRFPSQGINPAGTAAPPTVDSTLTAFPGSLLFSGSQENVIAGIAQMPHAWRKGSAIKPHIHWSKPTGSPDEVMWVFYYRHAGVVGGDAEDWIGPISGSLVIGTPATTNSHCITSFGEIDMTGRNESCILAWQVRRLGNTDADSGAARLMEFDIHYITNKRGTTYEIPEA